MTLPEQFSLTKALSKDIIIEPDWYLELLKELDSLFIITDDSARDSIEIKDLIIKLKTDAGKNFIK